MNRLEELCKRVEDEKILSISGGIFKTHSSPNGEFEYKANTTVEEYCADVGKWHNVSAEEYADELLSIMDGPTQKIVGECKKCFRMLTESEAESHRCDGEGTYKLKTPIV